MTHRVPTEADRRAAEMQADAPIGIPYFRAVVGKPGYSVCPACGEQVGPESMKDFESFSNLEAQAHWQSHLDAAVISEASLNAVWLGERSVRGETGRRWAVSTDDLRWRWELTGAHTGGPWWDVYVIARTPDGKHGCGQSHRRVGHVPGGRGRDTRILAMGLDFLKATPDYHDRAACPICTPQP